MWIVFFDMWVADVASFPRGFPFGTFEKVLERRNGFGKSHRQAGGWPCMLR